MNALSQEIKQSSEFKMSDSQQALLISKESSFQKLLESSKTHLQSSVPREDMLRNNISVALDDFVAASNAEDTLTPSACEAENRKEKEESDASLTPEQREQKQKRAEFVQELVMSSIFDD
ncbi:hypothetical protein ZIOFF_019233 [Zingiber officinale]|uniref:Di19 C-terminal domain-containing protein n=2 Tax=Zingiber officinale TaxID=94328 RepID=A0A8J5H769_ZINOF|nr:hypothetical protein ZIOFF_019233 [Zingiber officinale]